jgi:hypothetical protein
MALVADPVSAVAGVIGTVIDKIFPDPAQRDAARNELVKLQQDGAIAETAQQLSAILAEANSGDKWTSRARPAFLYLMYALILLCVGGAIVGVWWPAQVAQAAANIGALLSAIPESLWWLFGSGYLGYTGARSFDKWRSASGK